MNKQDFIMDYLQNGAQVFFNFVAEGALPEDVGLMTFLYDEEAVDYCFNNPNEWVLYLSVVVRDEYGKKPFLSFSPGLMKYKGKDENTQVDEWEHKYYLDFLKAAE